MDISGAGGVPPSSPGRNAGNPSGGDGARPRRIAAHPALPGHPAGRAAGGSLSPRSTSLLAGGQVGPQSPHPLPKDEPVSDSDTSDTSDTSDSGELPDGLALPCGTVSTHIRVIRAALNDPAIGPELGRWMQQENGVSEAVAERVVSALTACRSDPKGRLVINGLDLPTDPLPDLSVIVPHATCVDLDKTDLQGVPQSLLRLPALTHLNLSNNHITQLPEELCDLVALSHLQLHNTNLAALPEGIGRSGLAILDVAGCDLSALPPSMGEMRHLRELWISGNAGLEESPGALAPLAALPPGCEIHLNREDPFSPQDLLSLPAAELFAEDPESDADDPAEVSPLDAGAATWLQATAGPSSGGRASSALWAGFAEEANAPAFARWLQRMHATAGSGSAEVASGMRTLLRRMQDQPEFRRQCFLLAADALGECRDRVAMGFSHMQAALLADRAAVGELAPGQLLEAALQLFNRNAIQEFAVTHAAGVGIEKEELEVALALETRLRGRLALPEGAPGMRYANFARSQGQVTDQVVSDGLAYVRARQGEAGAGGLKAFLAGQGETGFKPWVEHLRRLHPDDFKTLNEEAQATYDTAVQALGGTPEAHEQAGVESKALFNQKLADLVWRHTQPLLPPADRAADFQAAATAARARQRLQRGDERLRGDPPRPPR